ncbi:SDR family oxidoreductase [Streptomyces sp. GC420]|uniref:SDR family NAD(P)-dependent oxidoreductase n=1 Tax=Streptomyces sp. GC420 TaxID=2697568 RepID=UPI001414E135|nr:SDR family oxidoreductase [Streptomyces sp. GC420]NBM17438.1 SDR family NAD(P)-dependent oxidoreductase [Streptomyces sp. GC420]
MTGTEPARLALVTGAGGGIGLGVTRMLAARGHQLLTVELNDELASAAAAAAGGEALPVACDARDRRDVAALCDRIRGEWAERLDVIVCNAGVIVPGNVVDTGPDDLTAQLEVMLTSTIQLVAAAADVMKRRRSGHILATVSMGGVLALPGSAGYSAAKSGLRAFLAALSAELRGSGVAVSGIYPSGVDTRMLEHEARNGGSMLNFVGKVLSVDDVVRGYEQALRTRRLEIFLPYGDSLVSRLMAVSPGLSNRAIPLLERIGRRGHARYLARKDRPVP